MVSDHAEKYQAFRTLHQQPGCFVLPNAWTAGSAMILEDMGFDAIATTSSGLAKDLGRRDSFGEISGDEILKNAGEIVSATRLPVSADLENGFGDAPDACAETIRRAVDVGLVGGTLEDATGDESAPIYPFDQAVARVKSAVDAARDLPFLLTARAENFLYGRPDLDDTIRRLQAFETAGADVLYAPGLPSLDAIKKVCSEVNKPVNVVMGLMKPSLSMSELEAAGVKRVSVGGAFARAAYQTFIKAAQEVKERGTFTFAERNGGFEPPPGTEGS